MDAATKVQACDPFFTTKEVGQGTGMGLALVYGIMESYNGSVNIESSVSKGSTVTLYFPMTTQEETKHQAKKVSKQYI